ERTGAAEALEDGKRLVHTLAEFVLSLPVGPDDSDEVGPGGPVAQADVNDRAGDRLFDDDGARAHLDISPDPEGVDAVVALALGVATQPHGLPLVLHLAHVQPALRSPLLQGQQVQLAVPVEVNRGLDVARQGNWRRTEGAFLVAQPEHGPGRSG